MKLFKWCRDGAPDSGVQGLFFVEIKPAFSIALLRFSKGNMQGVLHEHAFWALTLWLKGRVREHHLDGRVLEFRSGDLKVTPRSTFHRIEPLTTTWALSVRGPWVDHWREWRGRFVTLTHGRNVVN